MALKGRLRSNRSKRFGNVENGHHLTSEATSFSTSDSEPDCFDSKKKVRDWFSTKRLMKESECFTVDNDHIYTSARPSETVYDSIRKRKISEEGDEKLPKKRCFSKNAVMARLNRERKKKYVSSLEIENESLRKENSEMSREMEEQRKQVSIMRREILYLKGLLANSKELGQILKNLKDVTGLPVTSSIITAPKVETPGKSHENDQTLFEYHHPRIRTVNSGRNFPILNKDINLGSCSDKSFNDMADLESCPFNFENHSNDEFLPYVNDDEFFNFSTKNLDLELEEYLKIEDLSKSKEPEAGICLHVNQKRISVEICSVCNSKAASLGGSVNGRLETEEEEELR